MALEVSGSDIDNMRRVQTNWVHGFSGYINDKGNKKSVDTLDIEGCKEYNLDSIDASSGSSCFLVPSQIEKSLKKDVTPEELCEYDNHLPSDELVMAAKKYFIKLNILKPSTTLGSVPYDGDADLFMLTGNGTTQLFSLALESLIKRESDVILTTRPTYGLFMEPILNANAKISSIPLLLENKYKLTAEQLASAVSSEHKNLKDSYHNEVGATLVVLCTMNELLKLDISRPVQVLHEIQKNLTDLRYINNFEAIDALLLEYNGFIDTIEYDRLLTEKLKLKPCPRIRGYFHTNPSVPLGSILSQEKINELANVLMPFRDIEVIDDLTYYDLRFNTKKEPGTFAKTTLANRTLTLYGISKQYALAGVRAGVVLGAKDRMQLIAHQYFLRNCMPSIFASQALWSVFTLANSKREKYFKEIQSEFAFRCDLVMALILGIERIKNKNNGARINKVLNSEKIPVKMQGELLSGIPGLSVVNTPKAGFFVVIDFSHYAGKYLGNTQIKTSQHFQMVFYYLADVQTIPGEMMMSFSKPLIRYSFTMDYIHIIESLSRIRKILSLCQDKPLSQLDINSRRCSEKKVIKEKSVQEKLLGDNPEAILLGFKQRHKKMVTIDKEIKEPDERKRPTREKRIPWRFANF